MFKSNRHAVPIGVVSTNAVKSVCGVDNILIDDPLVDIVVAICTIN